MTKHHIAQRYLNHIWEGWLNYISVRFSLTLNLLQEKDYDKAERYADLAMNADRYNPAALTNKGNTVFVKQDYEKAAEFFKEALRNDSSCTEALYNLGNSCFTCTSGRELNF